MRDILNKALVFGSSQVVVLGLQFVVGILVIRKLSPEDFALYTLANTATGMLNVLSDAGVSSGVMAIGGRVWKDPEKLGGVLAAGFHIRRFLSRIGIAITTPLLLYLLFDHGASVLTAAFVTVGFLATFVLAFYAALWNVAPALHQAIGASSRIALAASGLRSLFIVLFTVLLPNPGSPIWGNLLAQAYGTWRGQLLARKFHTPAVAPDPEVLRELKGIVRRVLPGSVYFCFSGQLTIWLLSIFGTTQAIAEVGALGRLGQLLSLFSSIFAAVFIPRFSRLPADPRKLALFAGSGVAALALVGVSVTGLVSLFPSYVLLLLGGSYTSLSSELFLAIAQSALGVVVGAVFAMSASRAWVMRPSVHIGLSLLSQVVLLFFSDISNAAGALTYGLLLNCAALAITGTYLVMKISTAHTAQLPK